jgi:two-component system sensor histidine kinase UhpB
MQRIRRFLSNLPTLHKILIGNSLVIATGAIFGTALTKRFIEQSNFELATIFVAAGITVSIIVNYFILRVALRPVSMLRTTVDQAARGQPGVRAAVDHIADPDLARLALALNNMLNRLDADARINEENRRQLRALSAQVIGAQEEERKRIARELHDETSQALATLDLNLERIQAALTDAAASERVAASRQLLQQTMEGLRNLVYDLRPTMLDDLGLLPAIRWYARTRLGTEGIQVYFEATNCEERLAPALETALFRIAQEGINNIAKHANAHHAWVRLDCANGRVTLRVEDDGRGFDLDQKIRSDGQLAHLGLFGIQERVRLLGGTASVDSILGYGTRVTVSVPADWARANVD